MFCCVGQYVPCLCTSTPLWYYIYTCCCLDRVCTTPSLSNGWYWKFTVPAIKRQNTLVYCHTVIFNILPRNLQNLSNFRVYEWWKLFTQVIKSLIFANVSWLLVMALVVKLPISQYIGHFKHKTVLRYLLIIFDMKNVPRLYNITSILPITTLTLNRTIQFEE